MKNLFTILIAILCVLQVNSQSTSNFSYQAVVRKADNSLLSNGNVGVKVSILETSISGSVVFSETHVISTNENGLLSFEIGAGTPVSGTLSGIVWSDPPYFVKTEMDLTGGTSYTLSNTSQLLSVPYALHAFTADSIIGGINIPNTGWVKNTDTTSTTLRVGIGISSPSFPLEVISASGSAIAGKSTTTNAGSNHGIFGEAGNGAVNNYGVYGRNIYSSGNQNIGVFGEAVGINSVLNSGIAGYSSGNSTGYVFGGTFNANSTSGFSGVAIGNYSQATGVGAGYHVGSYSVGGDEVTLALATNSYYGVFGSATDTVSSKVLNNGIYGFASGNKTDNVGIDATAGSDVGNNTGLAAYTYEITTGTNKSIYAYATKNGASNYAVFAEVNNSGTSLNNYSGYFKGAPLAVENDDIVVADPTKGVVLSAPNGTCYRIKVDNAGALSTEVITCP